MATLAEVIAEIAVIRGSLNAASFRKSYGIGDRSFTGPSIPELEARLSRLCREQDELTAAAAGATNPMFTTAVWR
jgi:hypothetical protein